VYIKQNIHKIGISKYIEAAGNHLYTLYRYIHTLYMYICFLIVYVTLRPTHKYQIINFTHDVKYDIQLVYVVSQFIYMLNA